MSTTRRAVDYRVDPFDLQLFGAVAEQGSITAAASAMSLSLAAASARIKALEHRVGAQLLERSKRGAVLTDAGRALLRQAQRVLGELDALHLEMAVYGRGLRGTVRLLCNTAAMSELLPPRLARFLVAHPEIDVDVRERASDEVLKGLREGLADVGIAADHVGTEGLDVQPWLEDELVALLPAPRRARGGAVSFAQLLAQPFVGLPADSGLSRFLLRQAARSGRVPQHRVRVGGFEAIARIVAAGVGVAVMPRSAAARWSDGPVRIAPLQEPWARRRLLICTRPDARSLPAAAALVASLLAEGPA